MTSSNGPKSVMLQDETELKGHQAKLGDLFGKVRANTKSKYWESGVLELPI